MTAAPRVSVLIPVHDAGPFLAEALDSVLAQTFDGWEAIVVDDASHDGSHAVAQGYAAAHPERIRAIALAENAGVAGARNAAAAAARGDLLALLDQDDRWHPEYLERTVGRFDADALAGRRTGVVACDAELEQDGRILDETYLDRAGHVDRVDLDVMLVRNAVHARALVRRRAFDDVGGFAPACLASDDFDLWMRVLEAGWEVATVPRALTVFRLHSASQSNDQVRMSAGAIVAYRRAIARGALSAAQVAVARRQIRHHRALLARERVRAARAGGGPVALVVAAARAAPHGLVAFAQAPSRWGEWLRPRSPGGRPAGAGSARPAR